MRTICPKGETVPGVDISYAQPKADLASWMKNWGTKFAIIKGVEGGKVDSTFKDHWAQADALLKSDNFCYGAYLYFHPGQSGKAQATLLSGLTGRLKAGQFGCVVDAETTDGVATAKDTANLLECLQTLEVLTGKIPGLYGSPAFLAALGLTGQFTRYWLWIAHPYAKCPLIPNPFPGWTMWQYTWRLSQENLDGTKFNGTLSQLHAFAGLVPQTVTPLAPPQASVPVPPAPVPAPAPLPTPPVVEGPTIWGVLIADFEKFWNALV